MDDRSAHRQILSLGEQLVAQPTVTAQQELVVDAAARLVGGEANLWLSEALRWLPGADGLLLAPPPPSELMRRALDTRQTAPSEQAKLKAARIVAIPLLAQDVVLGVLEAGRAAGPHLSETEIELLDDLAAQSACALQASRQVTIERRRVQQLALVSTVSDRVANILELDKLCSLVTNLILDIFEYYYAALFILEPDQETLCCRASAGPITPRPDDQDKTSPISQVRLGEGIIGRVAQTGVEILANDVNREPNYRCVNSLPETRSEVALPLKIEDRVLGVLDVQSDQIDDFDDTDMLVLRSLAGNIAIAVENAHLYGDLRRRLDQLSAVAEVSRAVVSILDIDTLLDEVVRLIREQFGYPFVHLFTVAPARGQIIHRAGIGSRDQVPQMETLVCNLDDSEGIVPWVACHGETVLANDVRSDSRYRPSELPPPNTRAELAVPLIFGDEILGVLDSRSDRRDTFDDQDRLLFEALADSVATALNNANLYRSERWRRQVADSLQEVAGLLSSDVSISQVLDAILVELERTLPCDVAAVWLLRDSDLCLSAVRGDAPEMCISDFSPDADSWLGQALSADQPIIRTPQPSFSRSLEGRKGDEPLGLALGFPPNYSAIAAPLHVSGQPLGILTLIHHTPGRYGTESRMITSAFASYAAVAIKNTRLYQQSQELARISTAMLQVAQATQSLTTLDEVLEAVARLVPTLVGVDRCAILLWDESASAFVPSAAHGLSSPQRAIFEQWRIVSGDEPAFDKLRLNKAPVFIYDVATDSRLSDLVVWDLGFESLLLLPLLAQGKVLGAMLIDYQSDWPEFGGVVTGTLHDERLVVIQGIALQTAAAVENTVLREAQQEEAYVSAALLQVTQAVANLNTLDDILSTIVRITPILVGGRRCIIFLWDDERSLFHPAQAYGLPSDVEAALLNRDYAPGDFFLLDAIRERTDRVARSPAPPPDASTGYGAGGQILSDLTAGFTLASAGTTPAEPLSLLALPLAVKGDLLGVMVLEEASMPRHSSQKTKTKRIEIITGIAHQAALAIQSDLLQRETAERERLERELQLAHEIQQTFMPGQSPGLPGWELAFTWRAAYQVAGDFYDFFELPDRQLGLVIADVADKGMPAALFMALTRTLMRAASLEEKSPAAAMARVNDMLVPDAKSGMFVTAIYAVLSLETGKLIYANAGHNLPLLWRSDTGELERLRKGGMALGVLEGVRLEEHVVSLEPADSLVFYTDGITEAFSPEGEIYGEERLWATIRAADGSSAQAILDVIDESVVAFIGDAAPSDDRTLMVLRRK